MNSVNWFKICLFLLEHHEQKHREEKSPRKTWEWPPTSKENLHGNKTCKEGIRAARLSHQIDDEVHWLSLDAEESYLERYWSWD